MPKWNFVRALYDDTGAFQYLAKEEGGSALSVPTINPAGTALVVNGVEQILTAVAPASSLNIGTEWTRIWGPNDLDGFTKSAEFTNPYPAKTAEIFRREGAAMKILGSQMSQSYGNLTKTGLSLDLSGGVVIGVLVYMHRINKSESGNITMYLGTGYATSYKYKWEWDFNTLHEGWNFLTVHTYESGLLNNLQTSGGFANGWYNTATSSYDGANAAYFDATTVSYCRIEFNGTQRTCLPVFYLEGVYRGGAEAKTLVTLGFDIQTAGLDTIKSYMDAAGFTGYAATPTANADSSNPAYLWDAATVTRLKALYNDGWDIITHSASHKSLGTQTNSALIMSEFESVRAQLRRLGMYRGADMIATPNGSYSNRVQYELARRGCVWCRNVQNGPVLSHDSFLGIMNPMNVGAVRLGNTDASNKAALDMALLYGANINFYAHTLGDSGEPTAATFASFLAYLREKVDAGLVEVVTPSKLITMVYCPSFADVSPPPDRFLPIVQASPWSYQNVGLQPVMVNVSGGTVSEIAASRDGSTFDVTGQTSGQFTVMPGDILRITYSSAPVVAQLRI